MNCDERTVADQLHEAELVRDAVLTNLRAKVEALAGVHDVWLYRDDVLALLDGGSE